jgi:two-component system, sensor histidine kinase ChiS
MTTRIKLHLSTAIQIVLVLAVGLALFLSVRDVREASSQAARAAKLNEAIAQLRFVTFENILHHDQRSLEQWRLKYNDITSLLVPTPANTPTERSILASMTSDHYQAKVLLDRLVETYQETPASLSITPLNNFQEHLAGQLLVRQQAKVAGAVKLAALSQERIEARQSTTSGLILALVVLMVIVTAINATIITRSITSSLAHLQAGAEAIAGGNLHYRLELFRRQDEFRKLAAAFNNMAQSLQDSERLKSEFILLASHQLRTPATAVKGFISMLLDGFFGPVPPTQTEPLQAAFKENEAQIYIADQLLQVAKIEAGEPLVSAEPTNLGQLITQVVEELTPSINARQQTITVHQPRTDVMYTADAARLAMAISTLVDNAHKYSPEHSTITVTLAQSATGTTIKVADQGYGIKAADQHRLFQKFSRLPNPNSGIAGGSGIGLYLAKNIVQLHGGHISVKSAEGKGSTFTIHLDPPQQIV